MENRCPKCNELLITKTIKKELVSGSIEYPVAEICPKCNWNRDLTGAGDIKPPAVDDINKEQIKPQPKPPAVASTPPKPQPKPQAPSPVKEQQKSPVVASSPSKPKPKQESAGVNKLLTAALAILVIGALVWVFVIHPTAPAQQPALSPTSTPTPVITTAPANPVTTGTPNPETAATGKKITVKLDRYRGYIDSAQKNLKLKAGDDVVWINDGTYSLTLISEDGLFQPKVLDNGKLTNYTFKKTGTYNFYLKDNKNLTGTVVVEP